MESKKIDLKKRDIYGGKIGKHEGFDKYFRCCKYCSNFYYTSSKLGRVCNNCNKRLNLIKLKGGVNMSNFKLFNKGQMGASSIPKDAISVGKNVIGFGEESQKLIKEKNFIEVYFDKDNNQVGLRPTTNTLTGFKIQRKGSTGHIDYATGSFVKQIPIGRYVWKMEGDMMTFSVSKFGRDD